METRIIRTLADYSALAGAWDSLLDISGLEDPYLSHGWIDAWWRAYAGEDDSFYLACCLDGDRLVGAFPGRIEGGRTLALLSDETVAPRRPGCIAEPSRAAEIHASLADHLGSSSAPWDVMMLRAVDAHSPFVSALLERMPDVRVRRQDNETELAVLALPDTWEEYIASLSSRMRRRDVNKRRRALEERGEVEVEIVADPARLDAAIADVLRMFEQNMHRRFDRPFSASDRYRSLLERASGALLAQDRLDLLFLTVDGERVAFKHQFRVGETTFAYQTGFDDAWTSFHVGTLVAGYAIEHAIGVGCTRYDFGPGTGEHKSRWGIGGPRQLQNVCFYRKNARGTSARLQAAAKRNSRKLARTVLPASTKQRLSREADWRELERL